MKLRIAVMVGFEFEEVCNGCRRRVTIRHRFDAFEHRKVRSVICLSGRKPISLSLLGLCAMLKAR